MSAGHLPAMSDRAFAGFLRLLLTPLNEAPKPSTELRAYLDYLSSVPAKRHGGDQGHLRAVRSDHSA